MDGFYFVTLQQLEEWLTFLCITIFPLFSRIPRRSASLHLQSETFLNYAQAFALCPAASRVQVCCDCLFPTAAVQRAASLQKLFCLWGVELTILMLCFLFFLFFTANKFNLTFLWMSRSMSGCNRDFSAAVKRQAERRRRGNTKKLHCIDFFSPSPPLPPPDRNWLIS